MQSVTIGLTINMIKYTQKISANRTNYSHFNRSVSKTAVLRYFLRQSHLSFANFQVD